jgi:CMP/dCMP kinase
MAINLYDRQMIIVVGGPTASGKVTIAKALAAHFGLPHLDTGLPYRAVGRQAALNGSNLDDAADALAAGDFPDSLLADPFLRDEATGGLASRVSINSAVRGAMLGMAGAARHRWRRRMTRW